MRGKYRALLDRIRGSYWFVPSLMTAGSAGLSFLTTALDRSLEREIITELGYVYTGGPEGARQLFATVASSMITVAGVTFSITIVALSLASQQFGPRVLHNFMHNRSNQVVLGTYVAGFVYSLLMLRTIRSTDSTSFTPYISVSTAVLMATAGVGVLIFFIHHISLSIQVSTVISRVGQELDESIDELFPVRIGQYVEDLNYRPTGEEQIPDAFGLEALRICATCTGYVQMIEIDRLMEIANSRDLIIRLEQRPGRFVFEGIHLASVWPPNRADADILTRIRHTIVIGASRTRLQDTEFSINQLVEIAVRALSPGINDPGTAIICLDRLSAALCRLAGRQFPSPYRYDETGKLRVIADSHSFRGLTDAALHEIRQYGTSSIAVTMRLLEIIGIIAARIESDEHRDTLTRHAIMVERAGRNTAEELDRADIKQRFEKTMEVLRQEEGS